MTVSVETNKSQLLVYAAGTDQYSWGTFDVPTDADVRVYVFDDSGNGDETLLTLATHYTVDTVNKRIELTATGHSFIAGLSYTNERIAIYRSIDSLTQSSEYTNQGAFLSQSMEDSFDQVYYILQEHSEILKRAIQIDPFDTVIDGYATEEEQRQAVVLPSLDGVTDGIVYFDSTLKQFAISDNVAFTNLSTVATNISDVNTVAADLSGDDTIGVVAADLTGSDTIGDASALVLAGSPGLPFVRGAGDVILATFGTGLSLNATTGELSLDADLDAVSGLTGTGFLARTGTNVWALRNMTATADRGLTISEPAGVSGNTVFTLAQDIRASASPNFAGGTFAGDISVNGVDLSPTGATIGQALGFPNSATTLEPYTPAGGGDALKAANETITGDWDFTGGLEWNGQPVCKSLPTIADMTALAEGDLIDGELVYVKSYGSATGFGGGYLRWDASSTATADDFLVFAPDTSDGTGRWVRTGYSWVSPEMAGAVGDSDGTAGNGTDDTAAFRRVGAVLEADTSMYLRCEQAGVTYRLYSSVGDTSDIWNVVGVNGFQWDMNGCTLYADRDIRTESTTVFPFQFDGGSNVSIYGGKLRTRARTIDQTSDLFGMRWFYFTGTGNTVRVDLDVADSVEAVFFQRISGTDAVTDRWRDIHARMKATRCTYGLSLSFSGDDAIVDLDTDGCFRSLIALGVNNPQGVIRSKNHRGGDLKISAYHTLGGDDCPVIGGDLTYIVAPADHSETFNAGINVDLGCIGVDGATIDGLKIRALIDSNSSKPERQALVFGKYLDDGSTADTTTGRGHVVRNVQISVSTRNADASSISGRLVELFHPTYNGNWTGETIDGFVFRDSVIKGSATNDVLLGLNGHVNGPVLANVQADSDLLTSGTHPNPNSSSLYNVNFANITATVVLGRISSEAGLTSIRSAGGVAGRYGSTTGVPSFVIESAQGGGNFAGALVWEDGGSSKFSFHSIANGEMRVYANGDSGTGVFCANWSAAGHYHPGSDSTFDLGLSNKRWRDVYADDYEATTSYSVGGNQVVGARVVDANLADTAALTAQTLTDNSGGSASDTIAAIGAIYSQTEVANAIASLVDEVNKLRADTAAQKTALDAALSLIRTHGLGATS